MNRFEHERYMKVSISCNIRVNAAVIPDFAKLIYQSKSLSSTPIGER